ncbi:beta-ketoacyl-[acyl-carrier-protein] synthase family protein [Nguyenibacter vanlangensis]|uniref:Uncharacterized protein n=1 Tax=Nguyenibacter vanlangensis TaxID=1216886 RepID=A0A7Y7IT10_9PROT|nr:hypothetical protein [Nguyenibacter vanlangensis]NVN09786.1 hypothetical protein [Nguyenibacter vanlangensis]
MHSFPLSDVGVVGATRYLPGPPQDISRWSTGEGLGQSLVDTLTANGCRHFHVAGPEEDDLSIVSAAYAELKRTETFDQSAISIVAHAHTQAFSVPPAPRSIVAEFVNAEGLAPALSFSVSHLACASVINAIWLVAQHLRTQSADALGLVLTSDRVFGGGEYRVRQDAGIMSDGGSAILIGRRNLKTRIARIGLGNYSIHHAGPINSAASAAIGKTAWYQTRDTLNLTLGAENIPWDDVGTILPINADRSYWRMVERSNGLSTGTVFDHNISAKGHACTADFAINLLDRGLEVIEDGKAVLACGQSNVGAHAVALMLPPDSTEDKYANATPRVAPALGIYAIATDLPSSQEVSSIRGTNIVGVFPHMFFTEAGQHSCPPIDGFDEVQSIAAIPVARGVRIPDMASAAVNKLGLTEDTSISHVLHAQCMLDENILGSTCLRIQHDHFPSALSAMSLDQLGTAGVPTALRLAGLQLLDSDQSGRVCLSAADKWVSPFYRRHPGLAPLGDAAAACVVGPANSEVKPLATIGAEYLTLAQAPETLWATVGDTLEQFVKTSALGAVGGLLSSTGTDIDAIDLILGDGIADATRRDIAHSLGVPADRLWNPEIHYGSAAPLFGIAELIRRAKSSSLPMRGIVWTVSLSGHAAAILIECPGEKQ